jgi:hypothetical protein
MHREPDTKSIPARAGIQSGTVIFIEHKISYSRKIFAGSTPECGSAAAEPEAGSGT